MAIKLLVTRFLSGLLLARQQRDGTPSVSAGTQTAVMEYDDWIVAMAKPDVAASFPYVAPNVSADWPGIWDNDEKWKLDIAVKADIPWLGNKDGNLTTGTTLALTAPDSLLEVSRNGEFKYVKRNSNWAFCSYILGSFDAGDGELDSTCRTALNRHDAACFSDLNQTLQTAMSADLYACPTAASILPKSCKGLFANEDDISSIEGEPPYLNGSAIFMYANESHHAGDGKAFDEARKATWAVLTGWMAVSDTSIVPHTPIISLGCARADASVKAAGSGDEDAEPSDTKPSSGQESPKNHGGKLLVGEFGMALAVLTGISFLS